MDYEEYIKNAGSNIPASPAFLAVKAESDHVKWPLRYTADVAYHDRAGLADNPERFGWILRENGTHLIRTQADYGIALYCVDVHKDAARYYVHEQRRLKRLREPRNLLEFAKTLPPYYAVSFDVYGGATLTAQAWDESKREVMLTRYSHTPLFEMLLEAHQRREALRHADELTTQHWYAWQDTLGRAWRTLNQEHRRPA